MKWFEKCFSILLIAFASVATQVEAKSFAQKMVMDATGAGIAVWNNDMGTYKEIQTAIVNSSGVWGAPLSLSPVGVDCSYPLIVSNSNGDTVVLWSEFDTGLGLQILKATLRPSGGSWQASMMISSSTEDVAVFQSNFSDAAYQVVINDLGILIATWTSTISGSLVVRASRYTGSSWSTPVTISP